MSDNAITITESALVPVMNVEGALSTYEAFRQFVQGILKPGVDFGVIPGTNKPSLLKPGAEKLIRFFGLAARFEITKETEDWDVAEPLFYYRYRCALHRISDGALVGEGEGSCNSREKKYRYRNADRICPNCGQPYIIKGKEEFGGGWLCYAKKGGCGNKWPDGAQVIEGQQVGQVVNPDIADLVNTIQKMSQKRALIAAVLVACNASDYFTQDLEDLDYGNPQPFKPQQHSNADFSDPSPTVIEAEFVDSHSPKASAQAFVHWIQDSKVRAGFWAWTKEQGVTHAQVHEALGVNSLKEYEDTIGAAKEGVSAYVKGLRQPLTDEERKDAAKAHEILFPDQDDEFLRHDLEDYN